MGAQQPVLSPVAGNSFTHHCAQVGYLTFNFVSSVVVTFINDAVFTKAEFGFPAYLCLNGFVATYIGTEIMRWFSLVEPIKQQTPSLSDPNFSLLVVVVGLSKTLNNASLKNNSMGFYQIFKLLVTPLVVLLEYGLDGKMISFQRGLWLGWVCVFVWLSVQGDLEFSVLGTMWAAIWIPFAGLYKVQWARVRKMYGCSTLSLMHAVMPYAIALQLVIAPLMDPPGIRDYHWTPEALVLISLSGLAAFFVTFSGFLVVGNIGPLAHTLLGPMKTAVAMVGAYMLYEANYSTVQLLAAAGALFSLVIYTHVTILERDQHLQPQYHQVGSSLSPTNKQFHSETEDIELELGHKTGIRAAGTDHKVEHGHTHAS